MLFTAFTTTYSYVTVVNLSLAAISCTIHTETDGPRQTLRWLAMCYGDDGNESRGGTMVADTRGHGSVPPSIGIEHALDIQPSDGVDGLPATRRALLWGAHLSRPSV